MSSEPKKPKGILKKPTAAPSPAATDSRRQPPKSDPREIAVQHARIIHSRREVEEQIQDSIIELSRFPPSATSTSTSTSTSTTTSSSATSTSTTTTTSPPPRPEDADAAAFKQQVRLFQPGDYEDLIEERNANGLCGYALCGRPRARVAQRGEFKLVNYGRADFSIVPRRELERWCSPPCARRAMFVKVQLNETAAWERAGIASIQIDLLEEAEKEEEDNNNNNKKKNEAEEEERKNKKQQQQKQDPEAAADDAASQLAKEANNLKIEAEEKAARDARDLALERGDTTKKKSAKRPVQVTIREKTVMMAAEEPSLTQGDEGHLVLDGYKTKFDPKTESISKGTNIVEAEEKSTLDTE